MSSSSNHTSENIIPHSLPPLRIDGLQFHLSAHSGPLIQNQLQIMQAKLALEENPNCYVRKTGTFMGLARELLENASIYCGTGKIKAGGRVKGGDGRTLEVLHTNLHKCTRIMLLGQKPPRRKISKNFYENKFTSEELIQIEDQLAGEPLVNFQHRLICRLFRDVQEQFCRTSEQWFGVLPKFSDEAKIKHIEYCVDYNATPDDSAWLREQFGDEIKKILGEPKVLSRYRENDSVIGHWSPAKSNDFPAKDSEVVLYDKCGHVRLEVRFDSIMLPVQWDSPDIENHLHSTLSRLRETAQEVIEKIHRSLLSKVELPQIDPQVLQVALWRKYKIKSYILRLPEWQHFISTICQGKPYHPAAVKRAGRQRIESKFFNDRMADRELGFLEERRVEGFGKQGQENIYTLRADAVEQLASEVVWKNPYRGPQTPAKQPLISRRDFLRKMGIPLRP